ncbi:MAG: cobyric acid synthase [Henriciella sp.]
MTAKALMLQGTGSDVGKSILTAALCRIAKRRGISVAPFKPQNMSNNAAVCPGGGEIGRAQALQARAAGIPPHPDMNPVLLKPQSDRAAQIVVHGQALNAMEAADYMSTRGALLAPVLESFDRLVKDFDLVLVEGAGSPAEVNLRDGDIANMGFARAAGVPVCLIGDIEKGGVIASLVGTKAVLAGADAAMIKAFIINKFRGDQRLFDDGVSFIEAHTGWPSLGIIPWLRAAAKLPAEDAVSLTPSARSEIGAIKVAAPMLSRMANFDDADPLRIEQDVDFRWVPPGQSIPRDAELIILFGTKSTLGDLDFIRAQKWDLDILAHARAGGRVLGICGGYQILGRTVFDPHGLDGTPGSAQGLGLLNIETAMTGSKRVANVDAVSIETQSKVKAYEIHIGQSFGPDTERPVFTIAGKPDGAQSPDGRIQGTYLHGVFSDDAFRQAWLKFFRADHSSSLNFDLAIETALEELADEVEQALDINALLALAATQRPTP